MTIEQKREIPQAREICWQSRLNTLQPNGLTKRELELELRVEYTFIKYSVHKVIPLYTHTNVINLLDHYYQSQLIK